MNRATRATLLGLPLVAAHAYAHSDEHHHARPAQTAANAESTAFGRAGDPAKVSRTIAVGMDDTMRSLTVKKGETVRFLVSNHGKVLHELVLGTSDDLRKHAQLMRKTPDMAHHGAGSVHVDPGTKSELVWRFDKPGEFRFACLIPGHYEAGMVGSVVVK